VDQKLQTLISLQAIDSRIAALEADAARLPREIAAIHAGIEDAKKQVEQAKAQLDAARKDQRAKEKDLEVVQGKRSKTEARLYEVKTNKEYSAVLIEIEDIKQEKGRMEEEVLVLMEAQERLTSDIREAEARFKQRETEGRRQEATAKELLGVVEADLAAALGLALLEARLRLADVAGKPLLGLHEDQDLFLHLGLFLLDVLDLDQDRGVFLVGLDLVEAGFVLAALGLDDFEVLFLGALVLAGGVHLSLGLLDLLPGVLDSGVNGGDLLREPRGVRLEGGDARVDRLQTDQCLELLVQ
jgi:hypothetical protein